MSFFNPIQIIDSVTDKPKGLLFNGDAPQICTQPYMQAIAEGDVAGHTPWSASGYTPTMTTAESDLWGNAGVINFPASAAALEFVSSDNTQDIGTAIFSGTSSGGSLTTLIDATKDFTASTAAVAGDCVILEKAGASPEYGWITAVAATTLTIAGGFSSGGSASGRTYHVVDYSAKTGAQAIRIRYLDTNYAEKTEIGLLNGTTVVATVNTDILRINELSMIVAGSGLKPVGNITIRHLSDTPIYSSILAGQVRAKCSAYTVPAGKTLYITKMVAGYATSGSPNKEYARLFLRANKHPMSTFLTGAIFYPYSEVLTQNESLPIPFEMPIIVPEKTDMKVSGIASASGVATAYLEGWLE